MTETTEVRVARQVVEAKRRGAERFAGLDAETKVRVRELQAGFGEAMKRAFCGPDNGEGRQEMRIFTHEEVAAWEAARGV